MPKTRSALERLEEKYSPEPNTGCWLWTGSMRRGYGQFYYKGRPACAHVVSYELYVGPVPDGMDLDHLCRMRCCVNPAHLEPVSHQENCKRGLTGAHNLAKTHCPRGHPLSGDNLFIQKGVRPGRACRACKREVGRRYEAKLRAQRTSCGRGSPKARRPSKPQA